MAVIDALLDICPRRTKPGGCDVLILKDRVYLVSEECDGEVIGVADDLIRNLNGIADVAGLDDEERAALLETVEEARVDDVLPEVERADPSA